MADPIFYTVTFLLAGRGTYLGGGALVQQVRQGSAAQAPQVQPNTGWLFTGWDKPLAGIGADTDITAQYVPSTYTVTFLAGSHGSLSGSTVQTVAYGNSAAAPAVTPALGYQFTGWSLDFNNVTSNISTTAQYALITYTVTFDPGSNGVRIGGGQYVQVIPRRGAAYAPEILANTGWIFVGWDSEFSQIAKDTTINAVYAKDRHTVVFDLAGKGTRTGGGELLQVVLYDKNAVPPTVQCNEGWVLTGWSPGYMHVKDDLTSVAQYSKTACQVTFNLGDHGTRSGGGALVQTVVTGQGATAPTVAPNTGYEFTGWDKAFANVTEDMTVTANYQGLPVIVTFEPTALGTITSGSAVQIIMAGGSVKAPGVTAIEGWIFIGWDNSLTDIMQDTTITAQYASDESGPVTCSFPCNCGCMTIQIHPKSAVLLNGAVYKPGICALSPEGYCCDGPVSPQQYDKLANESAVAALIGEGGDAGKKCNCVYSGNFDLYADGDLSKDRLSFGIKVYVFDSGVIYSEIEGNGQVFAGYSQTSTSCVVKCYNRVQGDNNIVSYTEVLTDTAYLAGLIYSSNKTNFDMKIIFTTPEAQQACREVCVASYLAGSDGRPIMSEYRGGRCPTFTPSPKSSFATRLAEGWHCIKYTAMEPDGVTHKKDCNGNNLEPLYELIKYKDDGFGWNDQPCTADCCEVFAAINREFMEPGLWWKPTEASGWVKSSSQECAKAEMNGSTVWKMYNPGDCTTWYQAIPPEILQYDPITGLPNPAWPWPRFTLAAPCSATCKFYLPGTDTELTVLETAAGELLPGTTGYMTVKSEEIDLPNIEDGKQTCSKTRGQKTCGEVSTRAPAVQFSLYKCVDCGDCYKPDGSEKQGFDDPNRYYYETVYGLTRTDAVTKALAKGASYKGSESQVIPYAHTMVPAGGTGIGVGCCAGAWGQNRWADTEHVQPCDWGIKYRSTTRLPEPLLINGEYMHWQTVLMMCCQCHLGPQLCNATGGWDNVPTVDASYTDFWGGSGSTRAVSVRSSEGRPCTDMGVGAGLVMAWKGFASGINAEACWPFYLGVTEEDWAYVYDDNGGYFGPVGAYCTFAATAHNLSHKGHYPGSMFSSYPLSGVQLSCKDGGDGNYYWTGFYRECRYCDGPCDGVSSPCVVPTPGSRHWGTLGWQVPGFATSWAEGCTEAQETDWVTYINNQARHMLVFGGWGQYGEVPLKVYSNASITDKGTFSGCAIDVCSEICGARVMNGSSPTNEVFIEYECWGWAYPSFPMGTELTVKILLDTYASAVEMCKAQTPTGEDYWGGPLNWEPCETCGDACDNHNISTSADDYTVDDPVLYYIYGPDGDPTEPNPNETEGGFAEDIYSFQQVRYTGPGSRLSAGGASRQRSTHYYAGDWWLEGDGIWTEVRVGGPVCAVNPDWRLGLNGYWMQQCL